MKKKETSLLVFSTDPGYTQEVLGETLQKISFGNFKIYPMYGSFEYDKLFDYQVYMLHITNCDKERLYCSMPGLFGLMGATDVEEIFIYMDNNFIHMDVDDHYYVEAIIERARTMTGCAVIRKDSGEPNCDFFNQMKNRFNIPVKLIGVYSDNGAWVKNFFNTIAEQSNMEGDKEDQEVTPEGKDPDISIVPVAPYMVCKPERLPVLIPGYIDEIWYGKKSAIIGYRDPVYYGEEKPISKSKEIENGGFVVLKSSNQIVIYVWILPSLCREDVDLKGYSDFDTIYTDMLCTKMDLIIELMNDHLVDKCDLVPFVSSWCCGTEKSDEKKTQLKTVLINSIDLELGSHEATIVSENVYPFLEISYSSPTFRYIK